MNDYINYFAYSYVKNNLDSINNCIESYLEDGNIEKCDNEVVGSWLGKNGPALFNGVECSTNEDSTKEGSIFEENNSGAPRSFGKEVTTGKNNIPGKQLSRNGCRLYADSIGYSWSGDSNDGNVFGCFLQHGPKTVYYNEKDSTTECGDIDGSTCLQPDKQYVDKENCAFYAGSIGYRWGGNSNDGNVKGCFVQHEPKTVYFNEKKTDTECDGIPGSICIQKKEETTEGEVDSFINIPKKSNGMMYVILFILAVFLFRKLKK